MKTRCRHCRLANLSHAIPTDDLLPDGVHPNQAGMEKMAAAWFAALSADTAKGR